MAFTNDVLMDKDFLKELKKVHKLSCKITDKLDTLLNDWELDEEDEELLNDLYDQAETLQNELYASFDEEED